MATIVKRREGFDHHGGVIANMAAWGWSTSGAGHSLSTSEPHTGTHCLRITNSASMLWAPGLSAAHTQVGIWIRIDTWSALSGLRWIDPLGGEQASLSFGEGGEVILRRGGLGGAILATSDPGLWTPATWFHVEPALKLHDSAGAGKVWVNRALALDVTGVDTKGTSQAEASVFSLSNGAGGGVTCFDDLFLAEVTDDAPTQVGDKVVVFLPANAVAAPQDWSVTGAATHHGAVGEATPSAAEYIESDVLNAVDRMACANMPAQLTDIHSVGVIARALKTDAGPRSIKLQIERGGNVAEGAEIPLTTVAAGYEASFATDPTSGVSWTQAQVDAANLGAKVTT